MCQNLKCVISSKSQNRPERERFVTTGTAQLRRMGRRDQSLAAAREAHPAPDFVPPNPTLRLSSPRSAKQGGPQAGQGPPGQPHACDLS